MATTQFLVRFDSEELEKFRKKYPWDGSLSKLCNQVLREFNELTQEVPSPSELTTQAVQNVVKRHY